MATIDMALVKKREDESRLNVRRSSPVLIWSGTAGIWIIAASKLGAHRKRSRVYKILDRIAYVGRGSTVSNRVLAEIAIVHSERLAANTSRGDVQASQIVHAVGGELSRTYHNYLTTPLSAEGAVVQLQNTVEEDDLTFINFQGAVYSFEKALFLGSCDRSGENESQEEKNLDTLCDQLRDSWRPDASIEEISAIFHGLEMVQSHGDLRQAFDTKRIETVLLSREQLEQRNYRKIFQRLA